MPLASLRSLLAQPSTTRDASCQRCGAALAADHLHLAQIETRALVCVCGDCYCAPASAETGYRRVPRSVRRLPETLVGEQEWSQLEVPVGLAFFFRNSAIGRVVLCYPGAAGVVESQLPVAAMPQMPALQQALGMLAPDVEALLLRRTDGRQESFLVPIDTCYELAGLIRTHWRGFGGGVDVQRQLDAFFARLARECDARESAA